MVFQVVAGRAVGVEDPEGGGEDWVDESGEFMQCAWEWADYD
jgi:hypothetical protein